MSMERFREFVDASFFDLERRLNGAGSGPWHQLRRAGHQAFLTQGVPTTRHEEWKYTNVLPLLGLTYQTASAGSSGVAPLNLAAIHSLDTYRSAMGSDEVFLCLIDGQYLPSLSTEHHQIQGLSVEPLTDQLVANDNDVRTALASAAASEGHPFVALNTALASHGVVIRIARGATIERPIHVAMITDARSSDRLQTPRVLVLAEESAAATIVESYHTVGSNGSLIIPVTEIVAHRQANVRRVTIHDDVDHARLIGYTGARVHGDAQVSSHVFCLGGGFVRNDLAIALLEPNAQGFLDGVSVLAGEEYADNHTVVDHTVPHCHSEELYKGVYDGRSVGVFNGKIYVRPQAQKTTAYQSNHSLLISERAQVNAKPQLEIWADDVKCSHGATTGQLDEEAVFYLQARGIGKAEARALMTYAFAAEVVERLPHEGLRTAIEHRIARKLHAEPFTV